MDEKWQASPWTGALLAAWRQVSEHVGIDACLDGLAPQLADVLPGARLWIRRLDRLAGRLETVAVAPWDPRLGDVPARRGLDEAEVARLERYIRTGSAQLLGRDHPLRGIVDPTRRADVVFAGGLRDGEEPVGVLLVEGDERLARRQALLAALVEPLETALRNDARVHELARLREAVEADNRALLSRLARDDIGGVMVGADLGLREVLTRVEQVAPTDAPVLILGETGSGKEVVARAIHRRSLRSKGPFLRVNCGALPPELVDSELFGHERGAFTGAVATRAGWFERADGGTLFLDEIGELPQAAQVRLLRVLQDGTFERVGGSRPLHADVRIVAATHRDLRAMLRDGTFREDLWYRIGVFPLHLPPLRERKGDIPVLAAHFGARAGQRLHGRPLEPTPADVDLLVAYDWPGNVRELAAVVERAAILGDGHRLEIAAALGPLAHTTAARPTGVTSRPPAGAGTLRDANRRAIEEALGRTSGRIEGEGGAAALLGIHPSTLRSRMKKLAIAWDGFRGG